MTIIVTMLELLVGTHLQFAQFLGSLLCPHTSHMCLPAANPVLFSSFVSYWQSSVSGEVVFNTGMVGYVENLTDPSYRGQILVSCGRLLSPVFAQFSFRIRLECMNSRVDFRLKGHA